MGFVRAVAAGLVLGVVVWSGAGPAVADDADGNWWYEQQQVAQAKAAGITGEGVPVAVIAGAMSPGLPVLGDAHLTIREPSFCLDELLSSRPDLEPIPATYDGYTVVTWTGSNMVAFIAGNGRGRGGQVSVPGVAPGADVRFYAIGDPGGSTFYGECRTDLERASATARAIVQAVDDGVRIIALVPAAVSRADRQVSQAVAYALHEKVVLVVPDGASPWFQALNGVVSVRPTSKYGWGVLGSGVTVGAPGVDVLVEGSAGRWDGAHVWIATEAPAGLVAGMLADVAQKWPQATNDQLIQTLVRNTAPPQPQDDGHNGYGVVDLPQMLAVDPTQYPDENPLIVADDGRKYGLSAEDIRTAGRPAWADPLPVQPVLAHPAPPTNGTREWVQMGAGTALAVAAGLVGAFVLSGRGARTGRSKTDHTEGG